MKEQSKVRIFDEIDVTPISDQRLAEISTIPDAEIDASDIPELDALFFATAKLTKPGTVHEHEDRGGGPKD